MKKDQVKSNDKHVQSYHERLTELYLDHAQLSRDPRHFDVNDPQVRMTRTSRGHHYAACTFAIHRAAHEHEWDDVPIEEKKKAQEGLAGGAEHLKNVKQFAMTFQKKTATESSFMGFPPIRPHYFYTENDDMTLKELINFKLTLMVESADYDKWLSDIAAHARKRLPDIENEQSRIGAPRYAESPDTRLGPRKYEPLVKKPTFGATSRTTSVAKAHPLDNPDSISKQYPMLVWGRTHYYDGASGSWKYSAPNMVYVPHISDRVSDGTLGGLRNHIQHWLTHQAHVHPYSEFFITTNPTTDSHVNENHILSHYDAEGGSFTHVEEHDFTKSHPGLKF